MSFWIFDTHQAMAEQGGVIWSGIRYPDDTFELLVNNKENEDKIGVVQSEFEKHLRCDEENED